MIGATITHLRTPGEAPMAAAPVILLVLAAIVTYGRRSTLPGR